MKKFLLIPIFFLCFLNFYGQSKFVIKGKVVDKVSKVWLDGITIGIKEKPDYGSFTDQSGNYTLSLDPGKYTLIFRFIGYTTHQTVVDLKRNTTLDIELAPDEVSLKEVEITATRRDENIKDVKMGVENLQIETINKIPVLLGEKDILKTIQLLPGVQSAGEGRTGFYVRGGSDDQNLIMLDNALVYSPSHLLGFFSTFNSDVVDDLSLYKGSLPAKYGGRLSSVLDVTTRDGDKEEYGVSGGIGLISSRLSVEGPIQKNKSSFIVAARRTYADALGNLAGMKQLKGQTLYFYDLNAKVSYFISDKDKLTLSAYTGLDKFGMKDFVGIDWGNTFGSLKWNHKFNDKAASATSLALSSYGYNVRIEVNDKFTVKSNITDYNLMQEFAFFPNDKNQIRVGINSLYRRIAPGKFLPDNPGTFTNIESFSQRYSWENAIFASNDMKVDDKLEVSYGLRLSTASTLGGGNFYNYDNNQNIVDTMRYSKGKIVKTYFNVEPRLSVAYQVGETSSVKASYARTVQNMHLLKVSNMEASPSDRWVSSNNYIKPEIADQVSLGYFRNFLDNAFEFSAEVYYKDLKNQADYKDGTTEVMTKENLEPYLLFGKGRAYGMELLLKKKHGKFSGWIGYTFSKSEKKINGINNSEWYIANQDRTHDVSIVGMYDLTKKWSISASWVYTSGMPMTLASGKYEIDGDVIKYFEGKNRFRTPAYHRLDLGATCVLKKSKRYYSDLSFSIYNAYGRKNPYIYDFRQNEDNPDISETYMVYLFSVIPSITWNFKF